MSTPTPLHDCFYSMVKLAVVRLFVERHVFLAIPPDGISITELSHRVNIDRNLLIRLSNFLLAAGVLTPTSTSATSQLVSVSPGYAAFQDPRATLMYSYVFDSFLGSTIKWPEYFNKNGFREPQSATASPFGLAAGCPYKSFYEVLETLPERAAAFNSTMAIALGEMAITGIYDFSWVAEYATLSDRVLIVDVGGGKGQALRAILEEISAIPASRCVLQDQAAVIQQAAAEIGDDDALKEVQMVPNSFFDEQPTKGALVYYIRRVLNDWSDAECVTILRQIRSACAGDSRVLISENLLPEQPSLAIAGVDLFLMNIGGKRRSEGMFAELASEAGFKIQSISRGANSDDAVIEMVLA
ncbi:O-methyltransferase-domain-containing protein [Aspergillus desertorum]